LRQNQLEDEVSRVMDKYADQLLRVESLQIECDRATCDCSRACQQLVEAQRKMGELRGVLSALLDRLGYTPEPQREAPSRH